MEFERNDYGFPVMWAGELPVDAPSDENEAPEELNDNAPIREPVVPPKAR